MVNSTATFTYKLPKVSSGGTYTAIIYGFTIPGHSKIFRVMDYQPPKITITGRLLQDSYLPNDTVAGSIQAVMTDGSPFLSPVIYSYIAIFDNKT
jgi:uncharacterized protein YfaS (alpha-2-macroglobulin family)